jgi:predicted transcriptional regulator of viral defense system
MATMAKKKKIDSAKFQITDFFNDYPAGVFTYEDLAEIMFQNSGSWNLASRQTVSGFVEFLLENTKLEIITLESEFFPELKRYIWGSPSIYAIAQTIKKTSYLSHGSAVFLLGLTDLLPKTVHLNFEQSAKPQYRSELLQENIDRAFSRPQRKTKFVYRYVDYKIIVTNGKFTNRLEVSPVKTLTSETVDATRIERTLIDITVRPGYAGGVSEVLEVYKRAKDSVSVQVLLATLKKLDYIYPYHQSIGFYMERAGYLEKQWSRLQKLGISHNFYITYQLPDDKKFDPKWRLYYPGSL